MNPPRRGRFSSAFTLVELLVVITIIGVLVATMLPALGKSREHAQLLKCLANERSIVLAMTTYSNDWKNYPPVVWYAGNTATWMMQIAPYYGVSTSALSIVGGGFTSTWPPNAIKALQCPSIHGKVSIWADQSYAPNSFFAWIRDNDQWRAGAQAWWDTQPLDGPVRLDDRRIGRTSEFVLSSESVSYDWIVPSWNAVHMYPTIHLQKRSFSFIDGHASASGPEVTYVMWVQNNGDYYLGRVNHPGSGEP